MSVVLFASRSILGWRDSLRPTLRTIPRLSLSHGLPKPRRNYVRDTPRVYRGQERAIPRSRTTRTSHRPCVRLHLPPTNGPPGSLRPPSSAFRRLPVAPAARPDSSQGLLCSGARGHRLQPRLQRHYALALPMYRTPVFPPSSTSIIRVRWRAPDDGVPSFRKLGKQARGKPARPSVATERCIPKLPV